MGPVDTYQRSFAGRIRRIGQWKDKGRIGPLLRIRGLNGQQEQDREQQAGQTEFIQVFHVSIILDFSTRMKYPSVDIHDFQ